MKGVLPVLESPVHLLWSTWVPKLTYFQLSRCYAHAICESDWVNCSPYNAVPTYLVLTIKYTTICQCKMLRFFCFSCVHLWTSVFWAYQPRVPTLLACGFPPKKALAADPPLAPQFVRIYLVLTRLLNVSSRSSFNCQCLVYYMSMYIMSSFQTQVLRSSRHWNRYRNSISCWWYLDSKFCVSVQWKIYLKLLASELKQIGVSKRSGRALLTLINGMWITSGSDCCVCQWRKCNVHG